MEFVSSLSCEEIKQRLMIYAQPLNFSNSLTEHLLLSRLNKNGTFYLLKTGGFISIRPTLAFVGRIIVREGNTYIVGKFDLTKSAKVVMVCFFGLAWLQFLLGCLINSNFNVAGKLTVFAAISICTVLGCALIRYVPGLGQKAQQEEVIRFIENHLLS